MYGKSSSDQRASSSLAGDGADRTCARKGTHGHDHSVAFYDTDLFLAECVADHFAPTLCAGGAAIVVATVEHRAALDGVLRRRDVELDDARREGRFIELDAAELLSTFMTDSGPDPARFQENVTAVIGRAAAGGREVRIYGEMVALLWDQGHVPSALALEDLWNDLADIRSFSLLCAYPFNVFDDDHRAAFTRVCDQHTAVLPAESLAGGDTYDGSRDVARLQRELELARRELSEVRDRTAALAGVEQTAHVEAAGVVDRDVRRLRRLYHASIDAIVVVDASGDITGLNSAAEKIFGYCSADAIGQDLAELLIPESHQQGHRRGFKTLVETGEAKILDRRVRVRARRADGSTFPAELVISQIDERPLSFAAFVRDIEPEVRRERATEAMAADMQRLADDNAQILEAAGGGIYRVNLAGEITYANPAAAEIVGCEIDDLLGKDAHALLHHSYEDGMPHHAKDCPIYEVRTTGEIVHVTTDVFWRSDGNSFPVDYTSAPIREDGEIVGAVCVFADITEQRELEIELREKVAWTSRIHTALREDRFVLFGQPIVSVQNEKPVMHELLVRMRSPEGTLFSPADFLPQAERFGLMTEIDRWVVSRAMRIAQERPVSVNLSAQALSEHGFAGWILDEIDAYGVAPGNLVFEITETAALKDVSHAYRLVKRLTDLGCGFALDDFGTGYGTFSELKELPVSHVKIDRSFVRDLASSAEDQRVVSAILAVARSFQLKTVAEGVEDGASYRALREYGVDFVQGYHFGRPELLEPTPPG